MKRNAWCAVGFLAALWTLTGASGLTQGAVPRLFPDLTLRYAVGDTNALNPLEGTEGPKVLTTGDLNNDGLTDVVSGNLDGSVSVLLGQTNGTLSEQILCFATDALSNSSIRAVVAGDFDNDGKADVVVGDIARKGVVLLLGNGDGTLSPGMRSFLGPVRALAAADLDEDGKLDLVVACGPPDCDQCDIDALAEPCNRFLCVLLGNGDGHFQEPRYLLTPGIPACFYEVAAGDLNGDGHVDVMVLDLTRRANGLMQKQLMIFANDGLANFSPDEPQTMLMPAGAGPRSFCLGYFDEVVADRDHPPPGATLDIVLADRDSSSLEIVLNQGDFGFDPPQMVYAGDSPRGVAAGDLDGDGVEDLVVVNRNANTISVLRGRGDGGFDLPKCELPTGASPREVVLADFNGDGQLDAAVNNRISEDISLFLGVRGAAGFLMSDAFYPAGNTPVGVVAVDLNADGWPDIATANLRSHDVRIRLNQGGGQFGPETSYPVSYGPAFLAAGDVDQDGRMDLVVGCLGSASDGGTNYRPALLALLGQGDGTFKSAPPLMLNSRQVRPFYLRLGDLSGDGILDAVVGSVDGSLLVFRGNGDGTFEPAQPVGLRGDGRPLGLALGDFDHDGRIDIATSRGIVFLNDGQFFSGGLFTNGVWSGRTKTFNSGAQAWAVETVDLDEDGNLDLIVALTFRRPDPIAVLFGKGDGSFEEPKVYEGPDVGAVALWGGDIDGDGIKDIVIGNRCAATVLILQGTGHRDFSLREIVRTFSVEGLAVADLNGDGKPDLVGTGFGVWPDINGDTNRMILARMTQGSSAPDHEGLYINEIVALNQQSLVVNGKTPDWVEFLNGSGQTQRLAGFSFAQLDSGGQVVDSWQFPDSAEIQPWGHLLVFCKKKSSGPELYAPFELSSDGETVALLQPDGSEADRVSYPALPVDVSYARFADGARFFCLNPAPTPGSPNLRPGNLNPTVERKDPYVGPGATVLGLNARVFDDVAIAYASVVFRELGTTNGRFEIPLSDDGLHGDKLAGDGYYGALLPPVTPGATLVYFFRAIDIEGQIVTSPDNHDVESELHQIIVPPSLPALRLSELMADNQTGLRDEADQLEDWIEIVNSSDSPQSLEGLALSKDYYDPAHAWLFPAGRVLAPGEYCVVFCDDDNDGPLHANFKLARDGDRVFLVKVDTNCTILDSLSFSALPTDTSFGVVSNGIVSQLFFWPTPGGPNLVLPPAPETDQAVPVSWRMLRADFTESGREMAFRWMGRTNVTWRAEWSEDLKTWTPSTVAPTSVGPGFYHWSDPLAAEGQRFYRIIH